MSFGYTNLLSAGGATEKLIILSLPKLIFELMLFHRRLIPKIPVFLVFPLSLHHISRKDPEIHINHKCNAKKTENTGPGKQIHNQTKQHRKRQCPGKLIHPISPHHKPKYLFSQTYHPLFFVSRQRYPSMPFPIRFASTHKTAFPVPYGTKSAAYSVKL